MRARRCIAGTAALLASLGAAAATHAAQPVTPRLPGLVHAAVVVVAPEAASAQPVSLRLTLSYEMQCGYPGRGPVVLRFPGGVRLPARLAATDVLVDGRRARSTTLVGGVLTIGLPPPPQVMCDVIGPGRLTVAITPAAGVGNPVRPGVYALLATVGTGSFTASFTVRPA
ncbi:MAG TPA: hypothetical protein VKT18_10605 [Acidimicrobiales bacterium]|nr:hypothetical protein [Acidimicrobiales bacterium]